MTDKPAIWDEFDVGYGTRNYVQIAEYDLEVVDLVGADTIHHRVILRGNQVILDEPAPNGRRP